MSLAPSAVDRAQRHPLETLGRVGYGVKGVLYALLGIIALDAAIVFSDILTIPEAMGLGLHFVAGDRWPVVDLGGDVLLLPVADIAIDVSPLASPIVTKGERFNGRRGSSGSRLQSKAKVELPDPPKMSNCKVPLIPLSNALIPRAKFTATVLG